MDKPEDDTESLVIDEEGKIIELGDTNCTLDKAKVRYVGLIKFSKKKVKDKKMEKGKASERGKVSDKEEEDKEEMDKEKKDKKEKDKKKDDLEDDNKEEFLL